LVAIFLGKTPFSCRKSYSLQLMYFPRISVNAPDELISALGLRTLAGVGWAMFGTVATTTMVDHPATHRRGRTVSLLLMSETPGLLLGSTTGGWLYRHLGVTSPFLLEAACTLVAAVAVGWWPAPVAGEASATASLSRRLSEN
jgi:MFS family permease